MRPPTEHHGLPTPCPTLRDDHDRVLVPSPGGRDLQKLVEGSSRLTAARAYEHHKLQYGNR